MKYYESSFGEYVQSVERYNMHPELIDTFSKFPKNVYHLENLILYGPSGVGKYSQMLTLLKKYSQSGLKYDKRITVATDKQEYIYRISDIHYEIDMALLGCNSKTLWHEVFFQIVDIVTVKNEKIGIIVCKNFHQIHTELLDIFYSYMQQYNHSQTNICIKFVILTEQVSFLPTSIINNCHLIHIRRPIKDSYKMITPIKADNQEENKFIQRISQNSITPDAKNRITNQLSDIGTENILNMKEINQFDLFQTYERNQPIPEDIFDIVCNQLISDICTIEKSKFIELREGLYNILTYNLDVPECIWYIITHFINTGDLTGSSLSQTLERMYTFLKYYNNNYRPIYHLESIVFYIITKIYKLDE
jgi:hypothetical protein